MSTSSSRTSRARRWAPVRCRIGRGRVGRGQRHRPVDVREQDHRLRGAGDRRDHRPEAGDHQHAGGRRRGQGHHHEGRHRLHQGPGWQVRGRHLGQGPVALPRAHDPADHLDHPGPDPAGGRLPARAPQLRHLDEHGHDEHAHHGKHRQARLDTTPLSALANLRSFLERRINLPVGDDALVLDVGSGDKPSWRADVLLDGYPGDEHHGQRSGTAQTVVSRPLFWADGADMPFADHAFDYVICSHVLEHVPDPAAVIGELTRVAKAGYVEVPEASAAKLQDFPAHLWWCRLDGPRHPRPWSSRPRPRRTSTRRSTAISSVPGSRSRWLACCRPASPRTSSPCAGRASCPTASRGSSIPLSSSVCSPRTRRTTPGCRWRRRRSPR